MSVMFPNGYKCVVCGKEILPTNTCMCSSCSNSLPTITGKVCEYCGLPLYTDANFCESCKLDKPSYAKAYSPFAYTGVIQNLIHKLKYDGKLYLAKPLSALLYDYYISLNLKVDGIVPVPLHLLRENDRKFNQAFELITSFENENILNNCVVKVVDTKSQASLKLAERKQNVVGAFKVINKSVVKGKTILVVDDVYTTGSTVNEVAKVLLKNGASKVYVLTLAHAIFD